MRVLAIGAHPDDLEHQCGGTLARYAAEGHEVVMAHLCNGNKGGTNVTSEELAVTREQEARDAAAVIGAEAVGGLFGDLEAFLTEEKMIQVVDLIREAQPDVILTHHPDDYMNDHIGTSQLVFAAAFAATPPLMKTHVDKIVGIVPMYYFSPTDGHGFLPTEYVDITDFIETKKQMVLAHRSQIAWIRDHHGMADLEARIEAVGRFWGGQCNCTFAEPFALVRASGRARAFRILP